MRKGEKRERRRSRSCSDLAEEIQTGIVRGICHPHVTCRGEPSSFVEQKVHRYRGICISTEMRKYVGAVGGETLFPWLFPCRKSLREEEELNIFFLIHRNSLLIPIRAIFRSIDLVDPSKNVHGLFITIVCWRRNGGLWEGEGERLARVTRYTERRDRQNKGTLEGVFVRRWGNGSR